MIINDIISALERIAPPILQESYDNAGLLTGSKEWACTGVMVSLDATADVVNEAIANKCNLVVAHHPIIFKGLKTITGKNYVEQTIITAIKNDIAIYAIHTNLDNVIAGVNGRIADLLALKNRHVLQVKQGMLQKLVVFVPTAHKEAVMRSLFEAGAGTIGNYAECSFSTAGAGTFKAGADATPFVGERGERHTENEERLEVIFPAWLQSQVVNAMQKAHPYEEVAYDLYDLANGFQQTGSGIVGELDTVIEEAAFLERLKKIFNLSVIRHTPFLNRPVKKVAICGGAGSFLTNAAISTNADIYITGDVKYHEFFDADGKILLADIGHFESEQFTIDLLVDILRQKFPNFAIQKTGVQTNPVRYFL